MITQTLAWQSIKEGITIIERNPIDLPVQLDQLLIIAKYVDELKRTVRYNIETARDTSCCGGMTND